jgi:hypothetical protein
MTYLTKILPLFLIIPQNGIFACMNMEGPTKQNLPPVQPDVPAPEVAEPENGEERSPIKIRIHRNLERGTELTYATIPIEDAKNISNQEAINKLRILFGNNINGEVFYFGIDSDKNNYGFINTYNVSIGDAIKNFIKDGEQERYLSIWNSEGEKANHHVRLKIINDKLLITPTPFKHGIRDRQAIKNGGVYGLNVYDNLINILENGFKNGGNDKQENSYVKRESKHWPSESWPNESMRDDITRGDRYNLELFQEEGNSYSVSTGFNILKQSKPEHILGINIEFKENTSPEEREEKMKYYKEQISSKYSIPVRFFIGTGEKVLHPYKQIFPKP